jgi:hypothetical protein
MMTTSAILDVYGHVTAGLVECAKTAPEDALGDQPGVGGVGGEVAQ